MDMGVVVEVDAEVEVEEIVADAGLRPRFLTCCCSGTFASLTSVVGSSSRFLLTDAASST